MIFINFKTYEETSGERGLALLAAIGEVSGKTNIPIIPVVQPLNLALFTGRTLLPLWCQHIDPITYGAHTGFVLPEEVVRLEAKGTFINHSEHKLPYKTISDTMKRSREVGLKTLLFAKDILEVKKLLKLRPDYIAYEPPELVGSTTTSVSQSAPEIIYEAGELSKHTGIPLIVGAGIHSTLDVKVAIEQGAVGVAVATDIVKAPNPAERLKELLAGFA